MSHTGIVLVQAFGAACRVQLLNGDAKWVAMRVKGRLGQMDHWRTLRKSSPLAREAIRLTASQTDEHKVSGERE